MLKAMLVVTALGAGGDYTAEMPSMKECLDARVTIAEQNPDVKTLCIPMADDTLKMQEFFGVFMNIIDQIKEKESKPNKKDGPWVAYHPNGQLEKQGNYKDGKEEGLWVYYFENGQLRSEGIYSSKMTPSEALRTP